ncbi:hypothetical protein TNCV_1346211 [Trichonephila clavipes]|nr:hypothetical protein TNCV_1346211 [Trichonephila clavipes]
MHVCNTSTLSLEKTALLDKLHKLEESNLEKVCLQHFGFSFAVVRSFSGWPTVKLKALLQAPLASPLREGNVPDGGKGATKEHQNQRIRWDRKRGRRASAEHTVLSVKIIRNVFKKWNRRLVEEAVRKAEGSVEDDERYGRPQTYRNAENIEKVSVVVRRIYNPEEELPRISVEIVHRGQHAIPGVSCFNDGEAAKYLRIGHLMTIEVCGSQKSQSIEPISSFHLQQQQKKTNYLWDDLIE